MRSVPIAGVVVDMGSALAALALLFAARAISVLRGAPADEHISSLLEQSQSPRSPTGSIEALLARIGRTSLPRRFHHQVRPRLRLEQAGNPISAEGVIGLKLVAFMGTAAVVLALGAVAHSAVPSLILCVPMGLAVARVPDVLVARRAGRRQRQMRARVPDLAELLIATTAAGLSPPLAFRRAAEVVDGPLGEELRVAVRGLELGAQWRSVLDELAVRTGDPSIRRLVRAMGRSQRLGTSLVSTLHNVAEDLRQERQARAEELARRAPVKMLFPLVFLILPAFLLLTVGPVLLATLRSLH
jgi:tight adherence protein C